MKPFEFEIEYDPQKKAESELSIFIPEQNDPKYFEYYLKRNGKYYFKNMIGKWVFDEADLGEAMKDQKYGCLVKIELI